jgi:DNA-binding NtrC family response regulator
MLRILLVEDDPNLRRVLAYHLEREGHRVLQAPDGPGAAALLKAEPLDLVLTDVRMPGMDGMELLRKVREEKPDLPVVVMTAFGTIEDAVAAMREGASDYLTKPVEREALLLAVQKAARVSGLARENRRLRETLKERRPEASVLGTSAAISRVMEAVRKVAPANATVLITGESGTGKELIAQAIHAMSPRAGRPFVPINCAAVPRDLLESELFGHARGAFTGAVAAQAGKFQSAHGGTLFLDEIGDMDLGLQSKILRVLQERVVDPVGSSAPVAVDVRVVAATHRDLGQAVRDGLFRQDLYWRLNVIPIHIPPLRERKEDVPLLLKHFYRSFGGGELSLSPEAEVLLAQYDWPGNVREIQNLSQRLAVLHPGREITPEMLPNEMARAARKPEGPAEPAGLWGIEREAIAKALRENRGNQSAAARALRIPRHVLLYRMKKFGIETS